MPTSTRRMARSAALAAGLWLTTPLLLPAQAGTRVAAGDLTGSRSTTDEIFAIKGWAGGSTDGGRRTFATTLAWAIEALPSGTFRYQYEFTKSRGPRLGTFGLELPTFCATSLDGCIAPGSVTASILQLPSATFTLATSWYDFGTAEADGIPLTLNPFTGVRFDFENFESGGGGNGTGLAEITWRIGFESTLAPVWGSFFGSPLLSEEEGEGGGGGGGGGGHEGEEGEEPPPSPTACVIDYGIPPDPITGETEIPGPPRAYNCGQYYRGTLTNGGWVATPGATVPEPGSWALLTIGLLGLTIRRRQSR